jgi:hypothetical protein
MAHDTSGICILNRIEVAVPEGLLIHAILDNNATTSILRCTLGSRDIGAGRPILRAPIPIRSSERSIVDTKVLASDY